MDLAELKFNVNTDALLDAAKKIEALGTAVTELNKVQKTSTDIAKDEAQAEKVRIKNVTDVINLKSKQAQAEAKAQVAADGSTKATKDTSNEVDKLSGLLAKLNNRWQDMAAGSTSAEASILNVARGMGATSETALAPIKELLDNIRALSKSPFDSAIGSIRSITQEFDALKQRAELASTGIYLNNQQLQQYSRIVSEVQGRLSGVDINPFEGEGLEQATTEIKKQQAEYLKIADTVNTVKAEEAERSRALAAQQKYLASIAKEQPMDAAKGQFEADQKAQTAAMKESTKAAAFLEKEINRVDFALQDVNKELQISSSNRLIKFQENLAKSGVVGEKATTQLEEYRKKLQSISSNSAIKKQSDDLGDYQRKVDYITRAVGPQLTDIFSGLATGQQSLYTIAIQQGGQLADQFGLMGIEANKMGGILANALPKMLSNITAIGTAFAEMAIGGVKLLGNNVLELGSSFLMGGKSIQQFRNEMIAADGLIGPLSTKTRLLTSAIAALGALVGVAIVGAAALFVALGVAMFSVAADEKKLSIALNTTGASLGLTKDAAVLYAQSMNDLGVSTSKGIEVITAMAASGKLGSESIEMITLSAIAMEKSAGIAIEDTVKAFEKMKEKPVEALAELASSTGEVTPAVIKLAAEMVSQGRMADASALAMKALADANSAAAERIIEDLHPVERAYNSITSAIKGMWNAIKDATRDNTETRLKNAQEELAIRQKFPLMYGEEIKRQQQLVNLYSAQLIQQDLQLMLRTQNAKNGVVTADNLKEQSKLNDIITGQSKIHVSQQAFIADKVKDLQKSMGASIMSQETLRLATQAYGEEWVLAQKKIAKVPLTEKQKEINKGLEEHIDIQNKANGLTNTYNNQLSRQNLLLSEGLITQEARDKVVADLEKNQPRAIALLAQQEKIQKEALKTQQAHLKVEEDITKIRSEADKSNQDLQKRYDLLGKTAEEQLKINREYELENKLREIAVKQEEALAKIKNDPDQQRDPLGAFIDSVGVINAYKEQVKAANAEIAFQAKDDMQKAFNSIKSTITDSVVTALFEGGKAGSKKLRDTIVAAFRNRITITVDAVVNTVLGNTPNAVGFGGGSNTSSSGGVSGMLSTGKSIFDTLTGTLETSIANTFGKFAASSAGQQMGLSTTVGVAGPPTSAGVSPTILTSSGQMASTAAQAIGTTMAGIAIGSMAKSMLSGGYSLGGTMDTFQDIGIVIGSALGGPIGGAVVGAISGGVNRLFGRKLTETGIQGTFGGTSGFEGQNFSKQKGGLFRSDKTSVSAMDESLRSGLADQFKAVQISTGFMAATLGLGADAIANFTQDIKLNLIGLSEADAVKAIETTFNQVAENMASVALGTKKYNKEGESNFQTLTRLSSTLLAVNSVLSGVNSGLFDVSLAGADAAGVFADLFGGISNFTAVAASYYENFFSDDEKRLQVIKNINAATAGSTLDAATATRESFRSLVEAQDLTTEAGQRTYASLLKVSSAFAGITPVIEQVNDVISNTAEILKKRTELELELYNLTHTALQQLANARRLELLTLDASLIGIQKQIYAQQDLLAAQKLAEENQAKALQLSKDNTNDAYAALERAVAAEKSRIDVIIESTKVQITALKEQESAAQQSVNLLKDLFDALKTNIKELYLQVDPTSVQQVQSARNIITSAVGGNLPENGVLLEAISTVRSNLDTKLYVNKNAQDRDRLLLANELYKIQNNTEDQLTTGELQLKALKDQILNQEKIVDALNQEKLTFDDILSNAKLQIDALNGINTSVISVKDALDQLALAIAAQQAAQAQNRVPVTSGGSSAGTPFPIARGVGSAESTALSWYNNFPTDISANANAEGLSYWMEAIATQGEAAAKSNFALAASGILGINTPSVNAFAEGGSYLGGMALVGEKGPELINFDKPGQVYTASQTSSIMGSDNGLSEAISELRTEVGMLRIETRAIVTNTSKINKNVERVLVPTNEGDALQIKAVA